MMSLLPTWFYWLLLVVGVMQILSATVWYRCQKRWYYRFLRSEYFARAKRDNPMMPFYDRTFKRLLKSEAWRVSGVMAGMFSIAVAVAGLWWAY